MAVWRAHQRRRAAGDPLDRLVRPGQLRDRVVEVQRRQVGVRPRVVADLVPVEPAVQQVPVPLDVAAHHEEGRGYPPLLQRVEDHRCPLRTRPVVEREGHDRFAAGNVVRDGRARAVGGGQYVGRRRVAAAERRLIQVEQPPRRGRAERPHRHTGTGCEQSPSRDPHGAEDRHTTADRPTPVKP